ncbi:MAG: DUF1080 domain-containing protein [Planctomycetales bacterium]|nr:DUF1080 domain-containing protein [Planctomycetales bacterium]
MKRPENCNGPNSRQAMGLLFGAWFSLSWTLLLPLAAMEPQDQQASVEPPPLGVPRELREDEVQAGWLELFDGETLQGWKNEGDANFVVQEGRIVADTGTAPCLLRTTTQFDDYELTVDFRFTETTNSGVFLRTPPTPTNPTVDCFEVNIAQPTVSPFPTGSLVGREANPIELDTDQWHRMSMTIQGGSLRVIVDGERITQVDSATPVGRGYIGLQYNAGRVEFCNVFVQPLHPNDQPPQDLSLWRIGPTPDSLTIDGDVESGFTLSDGVGYVESQERFGDFLWRGSVRTHQPGVNSGVFFRCIPGSDLNGYESQIQNEIIDGDPARPVDHGTGGIFRRMPARQVWSKDETWFAMTIIAEGAHFAVWVEGRQVVDWTDERPADENPRRGRRIESGTLALQLHDAGTAVSFRDILARELVKRRK